MYEMNPSNVRKVTFPKNASALEWANTQDTLTSNADILVLETNPQLSFLDNSGVGKSVRKIEQSRESLHLQFKVLQK